jgi:hypothetical protein
MIHSKGWNEVLPTFVSIKFFLLSCADNVGVACHEASKQLDLVCYIIVPMTKERKVLTVLHL